MIFNVEQFLICDVPGCGCTYGFKHVLDGDVVVFVTARKNRAAVQHDARNVQPQQSHGGARNGFVAGDEGDNAVEHVTARDQLDRVGDHLSAH